jgi:hypothetical protein
MRLTQHSKNELKFANTNIKKEYGFGVVVLLAFVGLIIAGPWYFGDELNWFMYGLFIIASIGSSLNTALPTFFHPLACLYTTYTPGFC